MLRSADRGGNIASTKKLEISICTYILEKNYVLDRSRLKHLISQTYEALTDYDYSSILSCLKP